MRYHIIYSVFCMMLYAARGPGQLIGEVIDSSKFGDSPSGWSGEYARKIVGLKGADIIRDSEWKVHSKRALFSISSSSDTGNERIPDEKSIGGSMFNFPGSTNSSEFHKDKEGRNVKNPIEDDPFENEKLHQPAERIGEFSKFRTGSTASYSGSLSRRQSPEIAEKLHRKEISRGRIAEQVEIDEENSRRRNERSRDSRRNVSKRNTRANVPRRNVVRRNFFGSQADPYYLHDKVPGRSLQFHGKMKRGSQLVPMPRNLYVLKRESQESENQRSLPDYFSNNFIDGASHLAPSFDNAAPYRKRFARDGPSAMLSFKAHMHHDVRNIGNNFRRKTSNENLHFVNSDDSPIDSLDSSKFADDSESPRSSRFNSQEFLQDNSAGYVQAPNYQNVLHHESDSLSNDLSDLENPEMNDDSNVDNDPDPFMAGSSYLDSPSSLQNGNPDSSLLPDNFDENQLPYDKWNIPDSKNLRYRESYNDPSLYQSPRVGKKYSWIENSGYNEPYDTYNSRDHLGRNIRRSYDDKSGRKYSLEYLDRYAKALSSMDEKYSNDLEDIYSQLEEDRPVDDFEEQREIEESSNMDDPSDQPQESLDDIENELPIHDDNSLKTREIPSLSDDRVEPALSRIDRLSNRNDHDYEISDKNDDETKKEERSFSNVIKPLTRQLKNLLSTIQSVNENLTKPGNDEKRTDDETQNKREIPASEKTRRKRHHEILRENSVEDHRDIDENDGDKEEVHGQKRLIDYSQGIINRDGGLAKQKKYPSVSKKSQPQVQAPIKLKRNPGIIDFLEKAFGMGTHNHPSVTDAVTTIFVTTDINVGDAGPFFTTKEDYSSGSEELTDSLKRFTESESPDEKTMRHEIPEKTVQIAALMKKTTSEKLTTKPSPTFITTASSSKIEHPSIAEAHEPAKLSNSSRDTNNTAALPNPAVGEATNRQTISPELLKNKSDSVSTENIKTNVSMNVDVSTTSRNIVETQVSDSIVHHRGCNQSKESLSNILFIAGAPTQKSQNHPSVISDHPTNNGSAVPGISPFTQTSSSSLVNFSKVQDVTSTSSHKSEEEKVAIDFSEIKKARESGAQEFLVKILAPEIVRNITNDGVVVRIPSAISSPSSNGSEKTNGQQTASNPEKAEIDDHEIEKIAAETTRSHVAVEGIQLAKKAESSNKIISKSHEINIHDGEHLPRSFIIRNNNFSSSLRETTQSRYHTSLTVYPLTPNLMTQSKKNANEDAVVSISENETGGNARVDITLKIPMHESQNRHETVARDSGNETLTRSKNIENALRTIDTDNHIKRSAYEDYGEAEDYDEYLGNYDLDPSDEYDLESPESPDAEETYAQALLDALESDEIYEDDYEPENTLAGRVNESSLSNNFEANDKNFAKENNHTLSTSHIWPEHFNQESLPNLDSTDSPKNPSNQLHQLSKRFQNNRYTRKNRHNDKKSKIRPRREKLGITSRKKKSEGIKSSRLKKFSPVRFSRKLLSISGFACNRKLFGFGEFDDGANDRLMTKSFEEFGIEEYNPFVMDFPNDKIVEIGSTQTDLYTAFEPKAPTMDMEETDGEFAVIASTKFNLPFLSSPIFPSAVFRDNTDRTGMLKHKNSTSKSMAMARAESLVRTCPKTPENVETAIAPISAEEEQILPAEQKFETGLATTGLTEIVLATEGMTETVLSVDETIEPIAAMETGGTTEGISGQKSTEETMGITLGAERKRQKYNTPKKTTETTEERTKRTETKRTTTTEKTKKTKKQNPSKLKKNAKKKNKKHEKKKEKISQTPPTISASSTTQNEGAKVIITTLPANSTSHIFQTQALRHHFHGQKSKPASKNKSKRKKKIKKNTTIASEVSAGRGRTTRNPESKTKSKKKEKRKKNSVITAEELSHSTKEAITKTFDPTTLSQGGQEKIGTTTTLQTVTLKKTGKVRELRHIEGHDKREKFIANPEFVVESTEETFGSGNSVTTDQFSRTESINGVTSRIFENYEDDRAASMLYDGANIITEKERAPTNLAKIVNTESSSSIDSTEKGIELLEDQLSYVSQVNTKIMREHMEEEVLDTRRTTEVKRKFTNEYVIQTTPLPVVIRSATHLDKIVPNSESSKEFDMLVTLPKILERPEEEPLTLLNGTRFTETPDIFSTTISSFENLEITSLTVKSELRKSKLSPAEDDRLSITEEDSRSEMETYKKRELNGVNEDTDGNANSEMSSKPSIQKKGEKKGGTNKQELLNVRQRLIEQMGALKKRHDAVKKRELEVQQKMKEVRKRQNRNRKKTKKPLPFMTKPGFVREKAISEESSVPLKESTKTMESTVSTELTTGATESSTAIEESTPITELSSSTGEITSRGGSQAEEKKMNKTSSIMSKPISTAEPSGTREKTTRTETLATQLPTVKMEDQTLTTDTKIRPEKIEDTTESSITETETMESQKTSHKIGKSMRSTKPSKTKGKAKNITVITSTISDLTMSTETLETGIKASNMEDATITIGTQDMSEEFENKMVTSFDETVSGTDSLTAKEKNPMTTEIENTIGDSTINEGTVTTESPKIDMEDMTLTTEAVVTPGEIEDTTMPLITDTETLDLTETMSITEVIEGSETLTSQIGTPTSTTTLEGKTRSSKKASTQLGKRMSTTKASRIKGKTTSRLKTSHKIGKSPRPTQPSKTKEKTMKKTVISSTMSDLTTSTDTLETETPILDIESTTITIETTGTSEELETETGSSLSETASATQSFSPKRKTLGPKKSSTQSGKRMSTTKTSHIKGKTTSRQKTSHKIGKSPRPTQPSKTKGKTMEKTVISSTMSDLTTSTDTLETETPILDIESTTITIETTGTSEELETETGSSFSETASATQSFSPKRKTLGPKKSSTQSGKRMSTTKTSRIKGKTTSRQKTSHKIEKSPRPTKPSKTKGKTTKKTVISSTMSDLTTSTDTLETETPILDMENTTITIETTGTSEELETETVSSLSETASATQSYSPKRKTLGPKKSSTQSGKRISTSMASSIKGKTTGRQRTSIKIGKSTRPTKPSKTKGKTTKKTVISSTMSDLTTSTDTLETETPFIDLESTTITIETTGTSEELETETVSSLGETASATKTFSPKGKTMSRQKTSSKIGKSTRPTKPSKTKGKTTKKTVISSTMSDLTTSTDTLETETPFIDLESTTITIETTGTSEELETETMSSLGETASATKTFSPKGKTMSRQKTSSKIGKSTRPTKPSKTKGKTTKKTVISSTISDLTTSTDQLETETPIVDMESTTITIESPGTSEELETETVSSLGETASATETFSPKGKTISRQKTSSKIGKSTRPTKPSKTKWKTTKKTAISSTMSDLTTSTDTLETETPIIDLESTAITIETTGTSEEFETETVSSLGETASATKTSSPKGKTMSREKTSSKIGKSTRPTKPSKTKGKTTKNTVISGTLSDLTTSTDTLETETLILDMENTTVTIETTGSSEKLETETVSSLGETASATETFSPKEKTMSRQKTSSKIGKSPRPTKPSKTKEKTTKKTVISSTMSDLTTSTDTLETETRILDMENTTITKETTGTSEELETETVSSLGETASATETFSPKRKTMSRQKISSKIGKSTRPTKPSKTKEKTTKKTVISSTMSDLTTSTDQLETETPIIDLESTTITIETTGTSEELETETVSSLGETASATKTSSPEGKTMSRQKISSKIGKSTRPTKPSKTKEKTTKKTVISSTISDLTTSTDSQRTETPTFDVETTTITVGISEELENETVSYFDETATKSFSPTEKSTGSKEFSKKISKLTSTSTTGHLMTSQETLATEQPLLETAGMPSTRETTIVPEGTEETETTSITEALSTTEKIMATKKIGETTSIPKLSGTKGKPTGSQKTSSSAKGKTWSTLSDRTFSTETLATEKLTVDMENSTFSVETSITPEELEHATASSITETLNATEAPSAKEKLTGSKASPSKIGKLTSTTEESSTKRGLTGSKKMSSTISSQINITETLATQLPMVEMEGEPITKEFEETTVSYITETEATGTTETSNTTGKKQGLKTSLTKGETRNETEISNVTSSLTKSTATLGTKTPIVGKKNATITITTLSTSEKPGNVTVSSTISSMIGKPTSTVVPSKMKGITTSATENTTQSSSVKGNTTGLASSSDKIGSLMSTTNASSTEGAMTGSQNISSKVEEKTTVSSITKSGNTTKLSNATGEMTGSKEFSSKIGASMNTTEASPVNGTKTGPQKTSRGIEKSTRPTKPSKTKGKTMNTTETLGATSNLSITIEPLPTGMPIVDTEEVTSPTETALTKDETEETTEPSGVARKSPYSEGFSGKIGEQTKPTKSFETDETSSEMETNSIIKDSTATTEPPTSLGERETMSEATNPMRDGTDTSDEMTGSTVSGEPVTSTRNDTEDADEDEDKPLEDLSPPELRDKVEQLQEKLEQEEEAIDKREEELERKEKKLEDELEKVEESEGRENETNSENEEEPVTDGKLTSTSDTVDESDEETPVPPVEETVRPTLSPKNKTKRPKKGKRKKCRRKEKPKTGKSHLFVIEGEEILRKKRAEDDPSATLADIYKETGEKTVVKMGDESLEEDTANKVHEDGSRAIAATKEVCLHVPDDDRSLADSQKRPNDVTEVICLPYNPEDTNNRGRRGRGRVARKLMDHDDDSLTSKLLKAQEENIDPDHEVLLKKRRGKKNHKKTKIDRLILQQYEWQNSELTPDLENPTGFIKEEDIIEREEEKLRANEQSFEVYKRKISPYHSRIARRKILESIRDAESSKTGFVGPDRMIRRKNWVRTILKDESDESFDRKKKPFTVNVSRFDYDEGEDNYKMKNFQLSSEKTAINISDEGNDENLDEHSEVPCDGSNENNDKIEENYEITSPESKVIVKKFNTPNPSRTPDPAWPSDKTSEYGVGGTTKRNKEFSAHPKNLKRLKNNAKDESKSDEIDERIKNNGNKNRRWRSIDNRKAKTLQSGNSSNILKRDVLGRKLSSFEENYEREKLETVNYKVHLKSRQNRLNSLASINPKIRFKKSIKCINARETPGCHKSHGYNNDNDYDNDDDEADDDYEDDEETDGSKDDSDDFSERSEDSSSLTEDNLTTRIHAFNAIFSAPTEGIMSRKKEKIMSSTNMPRDVSTPPHAQQIRTDYTRSFTNSTFMNVTTKILDVLGSTQKRNSNLSRNLRPQASKHNHQNIITINPLVTDNNATKSLVVSEQGTLHRNSKSEEITQAIIASKATETPIITIPAEFQQNRIPNKTAAKNPDTLYYHLSAEYADYGQDAKRDMTNLSMPAFGKSNALQIPKETEEEDMVDENVETMENKHRLFEPESTMTRVTLNTRNQAVSLEKNAVEKKTLPVFIKLDDAKLFELKNLPQPPAEIYVIYKCGPPMVVGKYMSTESTDVSESTITTSPAAKSEIMEQTKSCFEKQLGINIEDSSFTTNSPPAKITGTEKSNHELNVSKSEDDEIDLVPLCGSYVDNDLGKSLTKTAEQITVKETFSTSSILKELSSSSSSTTEADILATSSSSGQRLSTVNEAEQAEKLSVKAIRELKKRKRFVRRHSNKKNVGHKRLKKSRSSRSLGSKLNSVENWQAEVNMEKKEIDTAKSRNENVRRNVISSFDNLELVDEISMSPELNYEGFETVDRIGRSVDSVPYGRENKLRMKDAKILLAKRQGNSTENSNLLDKVMDMINSKNASNKVGLGNEYMTKEMIDAAKEQQPRSLLERVKNLISNAMGLGGKNVTNKSTETIEISSIVAPPDTTPDEHEKSLLYDAEKVLASLTTTESNEREKKFDSEIDNDERSGRHSSKRHKSSKNIHKNYRHKSLKGYPKMAGAKKKTDETSTKVDKKKSKTKSGKAKKNEQKHGKASTNRVSKKRPSDGKIKNKSKSEKEREIIPRLRELIEKKNLGKVEKVIVYVEKHKKKNKHQTVRSPVKNLHHKPLKRSSSKIDNKILDKDIIFQSNLNSAKLLESSDNKNLAFNPTDRQTSHQRDAKQSDNDEILSDQLENEKFISDGLPFDAIVSRVADAILNRAVKSENYSQTSDPEISVTVMQRVANGTESPHEKMTTELLLDIFNQPLQNFSNSNEENQKLDKNSEKPKNFFKSSRLTSKVSKRRMNLPDIPHKNRRRRWKEKIKREDEIEKKRDRNLNIIRRRLLRELTKKLAQRRAYHFLNKPRIRRSLLREKNTKVKSNSVPKNDETINEKIRIIYAMRRKNKERKNEQIYRNHFNTKGQQRHRRNDDFEAAKYSINEERKNGRNLHESFNKIVGKSIDVPRDSEFIPTNRPFSFQRDKRTEAKKNPVFSPVQVDEESLDIDTADKIPSTSNVTSNDTMFYDHMLDIGKQLLNKSNFRSASSSMKERNVEYSICAENSKNLCKEKYDQMKNLVHAGVHYLLRRFEDCENCENDISPSESNMPFSLAKIKRENQVSLNVEDVAKKIISFASKMDSHRCKKKRACNADENKVERMVEKFGIDELGLKSEKDKKSLADLIGEIEDVEKNVNKTLEIIKSRSNDSETRKFGSEQSTSSSTTEESVKSQRTKNEKNDGKNKNKHRKKKEKKLLKKRRNKSMKKRAGRKKQKRSDFIKKINERVKKSLSPHDIEKKNSTSTDKKKLKSQSIRDEHTDETRKEINANLTKKNERNPKGQISDSEKKMANASLRTRDSEILNKYYFPRYARDIDDTNIADFTKYRIRKIRTSVWDRAELLARDKEEMILKNFPNFLDLTNINTDNKKTKKRNEKQNRDSSFLDTVTTNEALKQITPLKPWRKIQRKQNSKKPSDLPGDLIRNKKSRERKNSYEKHRHQKKKSKKPRFKVARSDSRAKRKEKHSSKPKTSSESALVQTNGAFEWKLTGREKFVTEPRKKEVNLKIPPTHFSVRRKLQSSPQMAGPRISHIGSSSKQKKRRSGKRKQTDNRCVGKKSKFSVSKRKVSKSNKKRESQNAMLMKRSRARVKYLHRNATRTVRNHTGRVKKRKPVTHELDKEEENFRNEQKAVCPIVPVTDYEITKNDCATCICDLVKTIEGLRSILTSKGDILMKIINYECPKYEKIGDEIVLFSTRIIGDILPKSRRDLAEAKGMTYVNPEDLEDVLRNGFKDEKNDYDLMTFPGTDLYVPCNRDVDDVTWLTSISRPNYTWIRDDGVPVSGLIRKNGNLELYDVDSKDSANYTCCVNYIDPDNEEPVQNEYVHRIQVVTLPRYTLRGGNRYELEHCDAAVLDVLASHLPRKLNDVLCKRSICDAFIYAPRCYHKQISIRALIMPSSTAKLFPIGGSQCGVRCKKAVQDKIALMMSKNLQSVLRKSIVFRLPHRSEDTLRPIIDDSEIKSRNKRKRRNEKTGDVDGQVGLLVGCPAGYGFHDSHCFPCSPGSHSDNMGSRCKKCPEGTHQPNAGARTCRTCTNPFVEGCYQMLWNSSSAVMAILVTLSAVLTIFMIIVWMLCCGKGKKSGNGGSCARSTEIELKYQQGTADQSLRQPLIEQYRDLTEDDERWCDCEKFRKKKKRFLRKKLLSTTEAPEVLAYRPAERRQMTVEPDEKVERVRTVPISCVDSYRSYGGSHSRNNFPKVYDYAKPPLPLPDFPR